MSSKKMSMTQDQILELKTTQAVKKNITRKKDKFSFWQLWNMNIGFLGIQFAWGLQMANMSAIFEHLGAKAAQIPILWLAAPLTGLLIQPIVGNLSDQTWTFLGRRRPYFLAGAIAASVALIFMPQSATIWFAAGLLWILDSSANTSMVPFRAFVGDLLPKQQRTQGFAMQSVMVGIGAISASALPWILNHVFAVDNIGDQLQKIPPTVELSFYIGAFLLLTTVLWTIFTTPEYPPNDLEALEVLQAEKGGIINSLQETLATLKTIPGTMKQLAAVQFFTWLGIFCFFLYFPPAVARNIFGATTEVSTLYSEGIEWAGLCFAVFNGVCIGFSFVLPYLAQKTSKKLVHSFALACGGLSLISLLFLHNQYTLLLIMVGFGIAWSSALSLPYAMLSGAIPEDSRGIYQGIFNFFIVLPEIVVSLGFGWVMQHLLYNNRLLAVVLGGIFLVIAAALTQLVQTSQPLKN